MCLVSPLGILNQFGFELFLATRLLIQYNMIKPFMLLVSLIITQVAPLYSVFLE